MDRAEKKALVASLNRVFSETGVVVITRNHGLTVAQVTALRGKMREAGRKRVASRYRPRLQAFPRGSSKRQPA